MIGSSRTTIILVWLVLVLATCLSLWVGENHVPAHVVRIASSLLIGLALIKIRLVMHYMMEVRTAPFVLRGILDLWLIVAGSAILSIYWLAGA
jgi:Prokaryotic Cytochrome C oxidase subunit IV